MQSRRCFPCEVPSSRCIPCADHPTEDVRHTVPVGFDPDSHPGPNRQWATESRHPAGQPWPTCILGHQGVVSRVASMAPPAFPPGYLDLYGPHWPPIQLYPPQIDQHSLDVLNRSYEPHGEFLPGAGESVNQPFTVGPNDGSAYECVGLGYGDPGSFQRCGTNPGGPIHLTMSLSATSHQVSFQYLSQEVCRPSVRKTCWY